MVDWQRVQWIICVLAIIFVIFLFYQYRNNFYLWRYLVKSSPCFERTEKYVEKFIEFYRKKKILINVIIFLVILVRSSMKIIFFHNLENINRNVHENVMNIISTVNRNNYKNINIEKIIEEIIKILFFLFLCLFYNFELLQKIIIKVCTSFINIIRYVSQIVYYFYKCIAEIFYCIVTPQNWFIKVIYEPLLLLCKNSIRVIIFILLIFCGISTLNWFQKFNIILVILFIQFCFMICTLYCLRIIILFTLKSIFKTISVLVVFMFLFIFLIGILILNHSDKNTIGIRVTKGSLKSLKNGKIELFFKEGKKKFDIRGEGNKLWIKNDMEFENNKIQKILFNKGNEGILFMEEENKNVEFVYINNENTIIKDKQNYEVDISIEGKIIIVKEPEVDKNNIKNYIFIGNNLIWQYLNKIEEIGIEEDNFNYNLLNLFFFFLGIIYFWLKLYGKKSKEYYNYIAIFKIQKTKILLDRNKYEKFLTLSMFGLTIPNVWKIVTTKSIGEINSSIWTKIDIVYIILFSILLFCLITSKEISEYVKELEKENEKK